MIVLNIWDIKQEYVYDKNVLSRKDGESSIYSFGGIKYYRSRDALGKYPPYADYRILVFDLNNSMHTRQKNDLL